MKIRTVLLCLVVMAAVVFTGNPAGVGAAPNPPHNTQRQYSQGNCLVTFMHGNIFGAAYAKFRVDSVAGCGGRTSVRVTGYNGNYVFGGTCSIDRCSPDGQGWYQSTAYYSNLLASRLYLCSTSGSCRTLDLSGV